MSKPVRKVSPHQAVLGPARVHVQMPLPLLASLERAENAFFGLCVEAGRQVLEAMMEQDRGALCGPKWKPDAERSAFRSGSSRSEVTLGGRRIAMRRLRARTVEGSEVRLPSFAFAADRDPLDTRTMEAIATGVSTRKYRRTLETLPAGMPERSSSKSSVSRRFVALSQKRMSQWLSEPLEGADIRVLMIDGIFFRDHSVLLALGIDSDGKKRVLGVREGTTENAAVARSLLDDLIERGLSVQSTMLFVIDGSKALRRAIRDRFGALALVQRCQEHKRRNVLEHLPERLRPSVKRALCEAWSASTSSLARRQLERLASSLERTHPGAASSIREGLEETLTLHTLGVSGALYQTLRTTNAIENLNGLVSSFTRNVKRWRGGLMIQRWVTAAVLEASRSFRRIRGCQDMSVLVAALDGHGADGHVVHQEVRVA